MARFTNFATLSYNGITRDSNTVTGELIETLSAAKNVLSGGYSAGDRLTYVISLVNSGTTALGGLTVTDDLGGYTYGGGTVYPLAYTTGSLRYYVNGILQTTPTVAAAPPLAISGISVPAGGNAILIYEATATEYAPLGIEATITNTATINGGGLTEPLTAAVTIGAEPRTELGISKSLSPTSVSENGQLTYTFVIENLGSVAADAAAGVVLSDTFSPKLDPITVTFDGNPWAAGTNYTYDAATGVFATIAGQITVPGATYAQNANGTWTTTPGTATLVISGTV